MEDLTRQTLTRRVFVLGAASFALQIKHATGKENPRILLLNSWTSINIGDVAHPFGMLELLAQHLPECEVRLRPANTENGVKELLRKTFPDVKLVTSPLNIQKAKEECDFLINGSGADVNQRVVIDWVETTGKPYGIYGVSLNASQPFIMDRVNQAVFTYFRDSESLRMARELKGDLKVIGLGLDSTFGITRLRNDEAAANFLRQNSLEPGKFLCTIPRLRWSPHWEMRDAEFDSEKNRINDIHKVADHRYLLEAIIRVIRETDVKVLICSEDLSQVSLGKELLYDKLPDDVKSRVVWRSTYWLPDEAISTFRQSAGLFGNEMHSAIMCIINGIPAIVCRFREQGPKGYMWDDIGLNEWLFNLDDEISRSGIVTAVIKMAEDTDWAKQMAIDGRLRALLRQNELMKEVAGKITDLPGN